MAKGSAVEAAGRRGGAQRAGRLVAREARDAALRVVRFGRGVAERLEDLARELLEGGALVGVEAPAARRHELQVAREARVLGARGRR